MKEELTILWTNGDPVTAEYMVLMYAVNSIKNSWWEKVEIVVWGGATKLVQENRHIREKLLEAMGKGVKVRFCKGCAQELGALEELESCGFECVYMGAPFTEIFKGEGRVITI